MNIIRKIYLYLFSAIGLVVVVIGLVRLVDLGLKTFVFKKADVYLQYPGVRMVSETASPLPEPSQEELAKFNQTQMDSQRQRTLANSLAMIVVGAPLYFYHWRILKTESKNEKSS